MQIHLAVNREYHQIIMIALLIEAALVTKERKFWMFFPVYNGLKIYFSLQFQLHRRALDTALANDIGRKGLSGHLLIQDLHKRIHQILPHLHRFNLHLLHHQINRLTSQKRKKNYLLVAHIPSN